MIRPNHVWQQLQWHFDLILDQARAACIVFWLVLEITAATARIFGF